MANEQAHAAGRLLGFALAWMLRGALLACGAFVASWALGLA